MILAATVYPGGFVLKSPQHTCREQCFFYFFIGFLQVLLLRTHTLVFISRILCRYTK